MAKHSTIRDVARMAGVSTATFSRALSHPDVVAKETREAVLCAVETTGYQPNSMAVSLCRLETRTIVVLVSDIANPFYAEVFKGAEEMARDYGYSVLIGDLSTDPENGASYVDLVRARRADGIVLMSAKPPPNLGDGVKVPIIFASNDDPDDVFPSVSIDYTLAAKSAVRHLLSLGHRRIGHLSGRLSAASSRAKLEGYRQALREAGAQPSPELEYEGDYSIDCAAEGLESLMNVDEPPTALFAGNDEMAIGAIRSLALRGLSVPADCSLVGFDDIKFAASYNPAITTVRVPRFEIGREAMGLMIRRLAGEVLDRSAVRLPTELLTRESTAVFVRR